MTISERDISIIEKMQQYCFEIEEAHESFDRSFDNFRSISYYKNAVCLCIMQIGELSVHLSDTFKSEHDNIPWKQIRGMRNVVAHEYGNIEDEIVWETATENILEIEQFCQDILDQDQDKGMNMTF